MSALPDHAEQTAREIAHERFNARFAAMGIPYAGIVECKRLRVAGRAVAWQIGAQGPTAPGDPGAIVHVIVTEDEVWMKLGADHGAPRGPKLARTFGN